MSDLANNKPPLGSRQAWIAGRVMEAVVISLLLVFILPLIKHPSVLHVDGAHSLPFLGVFGALVFAGFAQAHQVVHGFVDARGVHYRRYLRWKFVGWEHIERIANRPMGTIHADLQGEHFPSRHLIFHRDTVLFGRRSESVTFDELRSMWIQARQS